jgi:hypothetical protein
MLTYKFAITKANKGKCLVILMIEKYKNKVENFIHYNQLTIYFFFNLHSGGWNQGPLDTAAT